MQNFGKNFLNFIDASPTPFHCCKSVSLLLEKAGFVKISENKPWRSSLKQGGKYYFTRNGSSIVAFTVGNKYKTGNGFKVIGAHTDSCVLKVKPNSKQTSGSSGCLQLAVETYGGGLWHTWFDRDLGIAGRVIIKTNEGFEQRLVHIRDPILRVPNLAIHLTSADERTAFKVNTQDHLTPILSLAAEELNEAKKDETDMTKRHHAKLLHRIAQEINCAVEDIVDFELSLCDVSPSVFGGASQEFVFAPRLDNQMHCFVSTNALIETANLNDESEEGINMVVLFDHEEVGSDSHEGAGSPLLRDSIERVVNCLFEAEKADNPEIPDEMIKIGLANSILVSADAAHSIHPNYAGKHEALHQPKMGQGTVIKTNQNQRYMTNGVTGFFIRELCRSQKVGYKEEADGATGPSPIPFQEFVVRNDSGCGSTIGPILASGVGIRTVDIGIPQLSMHSIREQAAVKDLWSNLFLCKAFFKDGTKLDSRLRAGNLA